MKQKLIFLPPVFLILFVVVLYLNTDKPLSFQTKQTPEVSFGKPSLSPTPTPTPIWPSVQNRKYGFQINYPPDWEKDEWDIEQASELKNLPDGYIWYQVRLHKGKDYRLEVIVWGNKAQTPLLTWLRWYRHEDLDLAKLPKEENFNFADFPALRVFQKKSAHESHPVVRIFIPKENKVWEIFYQMTNLQNLGREPAESELVDLVYEDLLKTFQFLQTVSQ